MLRWASVLIGITVLAVFVAFGSVSFPRAESEEQPGLESSALDLVNAVNALRASYGLGPYSINSILMYTAQSQADFLAATDRMTHSGSSGSGFTDRLLAAGYPLAGDLSLGGLRSENITGGNESMSAQAAVDAWTGDSVHLDTMISLSLTEIGAGVAVSGGRVYYVIDCAQPTTNDAPQAAVIIPVVLITPNESGDVIHEVKAGQTLWRIASAYEVKIDELKSMNSLLGDDIYPGTKLLVRRGVTLPNDSLTEALVPAESLTSTNAPILVATMQIATFTPTRITVSATLTNNTVIRKAVLGIIALVVLGGGIFTWLGSLKRG